MKSSVEKLLTRDKQYTKVPQTLTGCRANAEKISPSDCFSFLSHFLLYRFLLLRLHLGEEERAGE